MAAPNTWQYQLPTDLKPVVGTLSGYAVGLPSNLSRDYKATDQNCTAVLIDQDQNKLFMYVHEITMDFDIGGSYAQSHRFRQWYPRNFTQPLITITGQVANQEDYGDLVEFIRETQRKSLRHEAKTDPFHHQAHLQIVANRKERGRLNHQKHDVRGHIRSISRTTERWVNAPQFTFQFIVATASAGLFEIDSSDGSGNKQAIDEAMQIRETTRKENPKKGTIEWVPDPDLKDLLKGKFNLDPKSPFG